MDSPPQRQHALETYGPVTAIVGLIKTRRPAVGEVDRRSTTRQSYRFCFREPAVTLPRVQGTPGAIGQKAPIMLLNPLYRHSTYEYTLALAWLLAQCSQGYCAQFFIFSQSARILRNSSGPRISLRLRRCCSATGCDLSPRPLISRAASLEALRAVPLLVGRRSAVLARAWSTSRRIASGRDGWSG
jgi:hypothetical protein